MSTLIQMPHPSPANQRIGMNVRIGMVGRGIDQQTLGRALGLSQPSISRKLNGRAQWAPEEIEAAATLLRVSIDRLFQELPGLDSNQEPIG